MRYGDAIAVARLWKAAGGRCEVELGALEPLLWREDKLTPSDLVSGLVRSGVRVTMTTNASHLEKNAAGLKKAGLSLLRISWHTTDPKRYREISGHGSYDAFYRGIETAARIGLPISFNRVLLNGLAKDLPDQLDFISKHGMRLKLYDLMWTPELRSVYSQMHTDWRPIIREHVLPRTTHIERVAGGIGRQRLRFHLIGSGIVEVKIGDGLDRFKHPCSGCAHREVCLEEFGDYVRIEPELNAHFCYLRRDIGFTFKDLISDERQGVRSLLGRLRETAGPHADRMLRESMLRYILVPHCNYNCLLPGTSISWCHKTSGNYSFPPRPPVPPTNIVGDPGLIQINRR